MDPTKNAEYCGASGSVYFVSSSDFGNFSKTDCDGLARNGAYTSFQNGLCFYMKDVNEATRTNESRLETSATSITFLVNWTRVLERGGYYYYPWNCIRNRCIYPDKTFLNAPLINNSPWQSFRLYTSRDITATVFAECTSRKTGYTYPHFNKINCSLSPSTALTYWLLYPSNNQLDRYVPNNMEWNASEYACSIKVLENQSITATINFTYKESEPNPWNKPVPTLIPQEDLSFEQKCEKLKQGGIAITNLSYCFGFNIWNNASNYPLKILLENKWPTYTINWSEISRHEMTVWQWPTFTLVSKHAPVNSTNITSTCTILSSGRSLNIPLQYSSDEDYILKPDANTYVGGLNYNFFATSYAKYVSEEESKSNQQCIILVQNKNEETVTQEFLYKPIRPS